MAPCLCGTAAATWAEDRDTALGIASAAPSTIRHSWDRKEGFYNSVTLEEGCDPVGQQMTGALSWQTVGVPASYGTQVCNVSWI